MYDGKEGGMARKEGMEGEREGYNSRVMDKCRLILL